jgi:methionine sulfoxide reductase heme-binding subunit
VSLGQTLDHSWWLASRSAGVVAYLLLSASVVLGLGMALKLAPARLAPTLRAMHEKIALVALGGVAAHALLLLGDGWLRPGLSGVLVPFAMDYRPVWTGVGILAAYLTAGLSLTYNARRRIGARRWRNAHRLIPIAWAMAAVHVIGAGSDAGSLWLQVPIALTMSLALTLLGRRILGGQGRRAPAARRAPVTRRAARPGPGSAPASSPGPAVWAPARPAPVSEPAVAAAAPETPGSYRPLWARDLRPRS